MEIVAETGLNGLSLRCLAQRIEISVSSITNIAGSKAQLLNGLISEARLRDAAVRSTILMLAAQSAPLSTQGLAELADLALEQGALAEPNLQVFFCELIQASASQPEFRQALNGWIDDQRAFWQQLSAATGRADSELVGDGLFALSVDERAHATALQGNSAYRRLRRIGLCRLCNLDFSGRGDSNDQIVFEHLVNQLGDVNDKIGIDRGDVIPNDAKFLAFARAAAFILVFEGAGALTHRAVAARAQVPNSTLAYHFPTREDLVKSAIAFIIMRLKRSVFEPDQSEPTDNLVGYEIARSTFTLALEASRAPQYLGSAADMRRKRGENLVSLLNAQRPVGSAVDELGAQVLSVVSIGAALAEAQHGVEQAMHKSAELMHRLLSPQ